MTALEQKVTEFSAGLSKATDSDVIHLQTLRKAIGLVAVALPFLLLAGENLRDWILTNDGRVGDVIVEASISAYFHTGMREVFVGSLCAIAVFLVCYKGYDRRDNIAANIAGVSAFLIALFPTREISREAGDTGLRVIDSATLFSGPESADPAYVSIVHFTAAAIFFVTLAVMSLFLFTLSDRPDPAPRKLQRNTVFVVCGWTIIASVISIALAKLVLPEEWTERTSMVFWLETIAVVAFGISWLTKAEVFLGDLRGSP